MFHTRRILPLALCCCVLPAIARAGPNAGGTIIVHDPGVTYTESILWYCELGVAPASCEGADVNLEGTGGEPAVSKVWKAYAVFPEGSSPRLRGISYGIHYPEPEGGGGGVVIVDWKPCVGEPGWWGEIPEADWPGNDTGTCLAFQETQTGRITEFYWFAGYKYAPEPQLFALRDHPNPVLGGMFCDDQIPGNLDPIAGYGTIGFDIEGTPACPSSVPVVEASWGSVKTAYRWR